MVIERINGGSFAQEILRVLTGTVNGVNDSNFDFSVFECFPDEIDVFFVTAGVLDLTPAKFDLAVDSAQQRLFALGFSGFGDVPRNKVLRVIEQHSIWLAVFFQNLSAKRIRRVLIDSGDF